MAVALSFALLGPLAGACGETFSGGSVTTSATGTGGGGGNIPTTTSSSGGAGLVGGGTTTTTTGSEGGAAGNGAGTGGGAPGCTHTICEPGTPLPTSCGGPCVEEICLQYLHSACCEVRWGLSCLQWVETICPEEECVAPCEAAFGQLAGYSACSSGGPTSCKFITSASGTCAELCAAAGASCTEALISPSGCDSPGNQGSCGYGAPYEKLCVCSAG